MLDINLIREKPKEIEKALQKRDSTIKLDKLLELDTKRRELLQEVEHLRALRNRESDEIAKLKAEGKDAQEKIEAMRDVGDQIKNLDAEVRTSEDEVNGILLALPNIPHESVPVSEDKEDRPTIREWGEKRKFDFEPKNHVELGKDLGILDFEKATTMAGAQFPLYIGDGAWLEWALINFMFRRQVKEKGYTPVLPPHLLTEKSTFVGGVLPKFGNDLYFIEKDKLYLIPTAETVLTNMHRDEILDEKELPKKYVAYTPCYRREAGAYGAKERGLVRVHQFNKVEIFRFAAQDKSWEYLEEMTREAEEVVEALGLHYRTTLLVTSDMSHGMAKTYDIEVWLPGQEAYYEISSASNGTDYQARRANTKYRPKGGGKPKFVHFLNASGLATSRLMVAILENNQQEDGSVVVPEVLREFVGKDVITPKGPKDPSQRKKIQSLRRSCGRILADLKRRLSLQS